MICETKRNKSIARKKQPNLETMTKGELGLEQLGDIYPGRAEWRGARANPHVV